MNILLILKKKLYMTSVLVPDTLIFFSSLASKIATLLSTKKDTFSVTGFVFQLALRVEISY